MTDLSENDRQLLCGLRDMTAVPGGDERTRALADLLRKDCQGIADVDLARVLLRVAAFTAGFAKATGSEARLAGLIGGAAAELASLHLE